MRYSKFNLILLIFLTSCLTYNEDKISKSVYIGKEFSNKGFALKSSNLLKDKKILDKLLDPRSLTIYQRNLKKNTYVKITNLINDKSIIVIVGSNIDYPNFYNAVVSERIAKLIDLDVNEPYISLKEINQNSTFIAKKAKTFKEEERVANKAPVDEITVSDLGQEKIEKNNELNKKTYFNYIIKIADFYYLNSAKNLKKEILIKKNIKNLSIKKINSTKYRLYLGPFKNLETIKKSYNDISDLLFENLEIIKT